MFGVMVSIIIPFTGLNVHGAIERMYFDRDKINYREYIFNCLLILIISTAIVLLIVIILGDVIAEVVSISFVYILIAVTVASTQFIALILSTLFQVQIKPFQYGVYKISKVIIEAILSILMITKLNFGWQGKIFSQLIVAIIYAVIGFATLVKENYIKSKINILYIKHALRFGLPLVPHTLGSVMMSLTDRVFITNMVGLSDTGIYSVAYQIGTIINLLSSSFNQAYVPWLFSKLKENNSEVKIKIVKLTYIYFVTILLGAIVLSIASPLILNIFVGKEFISSSNFIIWISLGYAFNGMYLMVTNYLFFSEKTGILAKITFITALINIPLNYFFIKNNGAIGAAQATTLIYFFKFILVWYFSARAYKMPWKLNKI